MQDDYGNFLSFSPHYILILCLEWHAPVSLRGEREHHLGGTAARHEAAPTEVGGPASAAFSDELLDGERLDDGSRAQGALLLQALLLG